MIGNIESTKAMIERMSPDQLRQFAMMNSNDMIAMSLVSSVQSMRNKEKMNQQAQQTNAQPPKVAEQLINSIQPEQSGIAALPAQNMAMADGGIVGYAGGGTLSSAGGIPDRLPGETFSEYRKRVIDLQEAEEQAAAKARREKEEADRVAELARRGGPRTSPFLQTPSDMTIKSAPSVKSEAPSKTVASTTNADRIPPGHAIAKELSPDIYQQLVNDAIASGIDPSTLKFNLSTPGGVPATRENIGLRSVDRKAPETVRTQAPAAPAPEAAPAPTKSIEEYFKDAQKFTSVESPVDPYATQRAENEALLKAQGEKELESAKTRKTGLMALMKPREERIAQREAALDKQSENDRAMAIITAGLRMMQSTGKGLSGIAEGAEAGIKQYGAAMALSKTERQKISDARDAYEEFKFNAENMSDKEISANERKIVEGTVAASNKAIENLMRLKELNRADATALFKANVEASQAQKKEESATGRTILEVAGREKVADIAAKSQQIISEGRQDTQEGKTQFSITKAKIDGLIKEAKDISDSSAGMTKDGQARLKTLRDQIDILRQSMVVPGAESTMPPTSGTRIKFDAKGNPI